MYRHSGGAVVVVVVLSGAFFAFFRVLCVHLQGPSSAPLEFDFRSSSNTLKVEGGLITAGRRMRNAVPVKGGVQFALCMYVVATALTSDVIKSGGGRKKGVMQF